MSVFSRTTRHICKFGFLWVSLVACTEQTSDGADSIDTADSALEETATDSGSGGGDISIETDTGEVVWQNPPAESNMAWDEAIAYCEQLTVAGYDDWRLPTIDELRGFVAGCEGVEYGGACNITSDCSGLECWNSACDGCEEGEGPSADACYWDTMYSGSCPGATLVGNPVSTYWSITETADTGAWAVDFETARIGMSGKTNLKNVRCTR